MTWKINNEISSDKLNTENHIPSYSYHHTARGTSSTASYLFYVHDCGGINNPVIIDWYIKTTTSFYWGNHFGPDIRAFIEKKDSGGHVIKKYKICDYENKNITYNKSLTISDLKSYFGSAEGWYRIYSFYERDDRGTGTVDWKVYGYPCNSKALRPIRGYISPTSSGFITGNSTDTILSAKNLNKHKFGTY